MNFAVLHPQVAKVVVTARKVTVRTNLSDLRAVETGRVTTPKSITTAVSLLYKSYVFFLIRIGTLLQVLLTLSLPLQVGYSILLDGAAPEDRVRASFLFHGKVQIQTHHQM